ncbi:MAG: threonine/serine exporter family protein [Prevotella sp.]|nr:threonine/serine exporter family protein [Prevotella sp.]
MTNKELLKMTSRIGSMLIEYGAEIYRVEDSLNRIAAAYGFGTGEKRMEIFAIPTLLVITLNDGDELPLSQTKRIVNRGTNLDRVDKLNNLSRWICTEKPEPEIISRHLDEISKRSVYGVPVQFMSFGVVGAVFTLFFGGDFPDAVVSGILSVLIFFVAGFVNKVKPSVFFQSVICSMVIASCAVLISRTGLTDGFDKVIIGSSMNLVPGITLTNCMRDFIAGDFLAGLYTLIEAILIAVGMAVGAASAIALFTMI